MVGRADRLDRRGCDRGRHPSASAKNPRILLQVSSLNPVSHAQVARLTGRLPRCRRPLAACRARRQRRRLPSGPGAASLRTRSSASEWDVLGLVGGDGARETLRRLGASGIRIVDSLLEGIPLGVIVGGQADGMPVFTKAGGFGAEDALVRCVERIKA